MGWTSPRTWNVGEIVTKAIMDLHIKDNLRYLKGLDGATTLSDALILPDGAGFYLHIPILTTTQRDALTPTAGMLIYNSTTTQFNKYENAAWRADLGYNSAHANLSGLTAGDDHTQYQKESLLTTEGDIPYATAASTWERLPKGTALQRLSMNAGATAPEWQTVSTGVVTEGTYTGDNTDNRAITHGLGTTPKIVFVTCVSNDDNTFQGMINTLGAIQVGMSEGGIGAQAAVVAPTSTYFYVSRHLGAPPDFNQDTFIYNWVAIA